MEKNSIKYTMLENHSKEVHLLDEREGKK